ncbi:GAF domain-containing protein [uncultured Tateyamaria sp.]|uniref:GAF domain-containing protein n=1 Tax=uncultured Tateyamaria sp. TaxID=455651 RepID=UPI0026326A58|nr:GAF domain-containing protein [uncultured Tateyamaria sp.]
MKELGCQSDGLIDASSTEREGIIAKLDQLAEKASSDLGSDAVLFSILGSNALHSLGAYPNTGVELHARRHNSGDTICIHTIRRGAPLAIHDARKDDTYTDTKYVRNGFVVGYLGIPIVLPDFGPVGAICSITHTPRAWSKLEIGYLRQVAINAETILLSEMSYIENSMLSDSHSEMDGILAALSSRLLLPTSVYEPDGKLVFATASLLLEVPEIFVSKYLEHGGTGSLSFESGQEVVNASNDHSTDLITLETVAGIKAAFRVSCSTSVSGMAVCTWSRVLTPVN